MRILLSLFLAILFWVQPQASILFVDASSEKLESATAVLEDEPISLAAWWYPTTLDSTDTVLSISAASGGIYRVGTSATATFFAQKQSNGGGTTGVVQTGAGTVTINTWHHLAGTFSSDSLREGYLNGASVGTNTTSVANPGATHTNVGYLQCCGLSPADGRIAEAAIWAAVLTADEVAALAKGYSPRLIRPQSLRFYMPLRRNTIEISRGLAMTATGGAVADHPRIISGR